MPGMVKPYYIKNKGIMDGTYVRVGGTTRRAERYQLQELILEGQNRYYDCEQCEGVQVSENDITKLRTDMKLVALKNTLSDTEKESIRELIANSIAHRSYLEPGNIQVAFFDFDGDLRVNMYRKTVKYGSRGTNQTTQKGERIYTSEDKVVLSQLYENPDMTQKELAEKLNWSVDRVKYYLNKMKNRM